MYEKLKKCKTLGEIYEVAGQDNFVKIAEQILILISITPLLGGIMDIFLMTQPDIYSAYTYNDMYASVMHTILNVVLVFILIYIIGKIQYKKLGIKGAILKVKQEQPWVLFWLALLVWSFFSTLFSTNIKSSLIGGTILYSTYISHFYAMAVLGWACMVESPAVKRKIMQIIILVSDIMAVLMLCCEYEVPFLMNLTPFTGLGFFTNSNHFGYFMTISMLCMAGLYFYSLDKLSEEKTKTEIKKAIAYGLSYILHAYALMINDTLGAFLGVFFALIILMIARKVQHKKQGILHWIPLLFTIVITWISGMGLIKTQLGSTIGQSLIVLYHDIFKISQKTEGYKDAGTGRWRLWTDTVKMILKRPIFGYGPDVLVDRHGNKLLFDVPHNEYLECAFYLGIPGLILYLGGLISLCRKKLKEFAGLSPEVLIAAGALVAYLISAFFGVRKFYTAPFMYMFMGLIVKDNTAKLKKN